MGPIGPLASSLRGGQAVALAVEAGRLGVREDGAEQRHLEEEEGEGEHGEEDLEDDVEGDLRLPRAEQRGDGDEPLARLLVERRRPSTLGRPEASC